MAYNYRHASAHKGRHIARHGATIDKATGKPKNSAISVSEILSMPLYAKVNVAWRDMLGFPPYANRLLVTAGFITPCSFLQYHEGRNDVTILSIRGALMQIGVPRELHDQIMAVLRTYGPWGTANLT